MRPTWLTFLLVTGPGALGAETAYVTDSLRLGVHAAADTSDRAFENLVSGTPVEVLERSGNYARVQLADGREGWVRATFLVTDKPAAARIAELEAAIAGSGDQIAAAKAGQAAAEEALARLQGEVGSIAEAQATIERLETENRSYAERFEAYRRTLPLSWVLVALGVALAAGFAAGWWWLDAAIRRRHGGFRVY